MISEYFDRGEFACPCGCGFAAIDVELLKVLTLIRQYFGTPVIINSGCRCQQHNRHIGGAGNSQHCNGLAADIRLVGVDAEKVWQYFNKRYPQQYGIGRYHSWTHIDVRPHKARWLGSIS